MFGKSSWIESWSFRHGTQFIIVGEPVMSCKGPRRGPSGRRSNGLGEIIGTVRKVNTLGCPRRWCGGCHHPLLVPSHRCYVTTGGASLDTTGSARFGSRLPLTCGSFRACENCRLVLSGIVQGCCRLFRNIGCRSITREDGRGVCGRLDSVFIGTINRRFCLA